MWRRIVVSVIYLDWREKMPETSIKNHMKQYFNSTTLLSVVTLFIWVSGTWIFADDIASLWPETPTGESTGGTLSTHFTSLFQNCNSTGVALGYTGSMSSGITQNCMWIIEFKDKVLSGTTRDNIKNTECDPSKINNFLVGFSSTGAVICNEVD